MTSKMWEYLVTNYFAAENHGVHPRNPRQRKVSGCQAKEQMEREREKARLKRAERDSATKVQLCRCARLGARPYMHI